MTDKEIYEQLKEGANPSYIDGLRHFDTSEVIQWMISYHQQVNEELLESLQWALPLAKIAMDTHRMERIKCGHMDINGTYKNGETWVGIYQKEVDEIESTQATINKALGVK